MTETELDTCRHGLFEKTEFPGHLLVGQAWKCGFCGRIMPPGFSPPSK